MSQGRRTSRVAIATGFAFIALVTAFVLTATAGVSPRFGFIQSVGEFLGMPANSATATSPYGGNSLPDPSSEVVMGPFATINVAAGDTAAFIVVVLFITL